MRKNWDSISDDLKKYIIKFNPSFKQIHSDNMKKTIDQINNRRRDFSCVTCTRMTIFSSKPIYRKPSIRLFATQHPGYPGSSTVRVCGECIEHRTSTTMGGVKLLIPRSFDHDKYSISKFITQNMVCDHMIIHYGLDECDQLIRLNVLDGNIVNLYEEIRRPRWSIMKTY